MLWASWDFSLLCLCVEIRWPCRWGSSWTTAWRWPPVTTSSTTVQQQCAKRRTPRERLLLPSLRVGECVAVWCWRRARNARAHNEYQPPYASDKLLLINRDAWVMLELNLLLYRPVPFLLLIFFLTPSYQEQEIVFVSYSFIKSNPHPFFLLPLRLFHLFHFISTIFLKNCIWWISFVSWELKRRVLYKCTHSWKKKTEM